MVFCVQIYIIGTKFPIIGTKSRLRLFRARADYEVISSLPRGAHPAWNAFYVIGNSRNFLLHKIAHKYVLLYNTYLHAVLLFQDSILINIHMSSTISRVMYQTIIYLVLLLPAGSSDLPKGTTGRRITFVLVLLRMGFT